jgi:hypothetical protein
MEVEVEVLDVTEDEARTLVLSIDPLAALAETQAQLRGRLQELVPEVPKELRLAWEATARAAIETPPEPERGFSTSPAGGPFDFGSPEDYALGKAANFPYEGGPAIQAGSQGECP